MATLMTRVDVGGARKLRWTYEAVRDAVSRGTLDPETRYEILEGELYEKVGQDWPHSFAIRALVKAFGALDPSEFDVFSQSPLRVGDDMPEPDVAIVKGPYTDRTTHPSASDAVLVVEVADSSIGCDRLVKSRIYAIGGVPVYWIVDLNGNQVEVYARPEAGRYLDRTVYGVGDVLLPPFDRAPTVAVRDLIAPPRQP